MNDTIQLQGWLDRAHSLGNSHVSIPCVVMEAIIESIRNHTFTDEQLAGRKWRVGTKVPLNVYEGDRPICQCHSSVEAQRIVAAMNGLAERDALLIAAALEKVLAYCDEETHRLYSLTRTAEGDVSDAVAAEIRYKIAPNAALLLAEHDKQIAALAHDIAFNKFEAARIETERRMEGFIADSEAKAYERCAAYYRLYGPPLQVGVENVFDTWADIARKKGEDKK